MFLMTLFILYPKKNDWSHRIRLLHKLVSRMVLNSFQSNQWYCCEIVAQMKSYYPVNRWIEGQLSIDTFKAKEKVVMWGSSKNFSQ